MAPCFQGLRDLDVAACLLGLEWIAPHQCSGRCCPAQALPCDVLQPDWSPSSHSQVQAHPGLLPRVNWLGEGGWLWRGGPAAAGHCGGGIWGIWGRCSSSGLSSMVGLRAQWGALPSRLPGSKPQPRPEWASRAGRSHPERAQLGAGQWPTYEPRKARGWGSEGPRSRRS